MDGGEYARLALNTVITSANAEEVALVVVAIGKDGGVHLSTNILRYRDIAQALLDALEAHADPDWTGPVIGPAKA